MVRYWAVRVAVRHGKTIAVARSRQDAESWAAGCEYRNVVVEERIGARLPWGLEGRDVARVG